MKYKIFSCAPLKYQIQNTIFLSYKCFLIKNILNIFPTLFVSQRRKMMGARGDNRACGFCQ